MKSRRVATAVAAILAATALLFAPAVANAKPASPESGASIQGGGCYTGIYRVTWNYLGVYRWNGAAYVQIDTKRYGQTVQGWTGSGSDGYLDLYTPGSTTIVDARGVDWVGCVY